jgi:PilZ domain-containing protein
MGKRREPRKDVKLPVRIFGTDSSGQIFSEKVFTINVSRHGAELINVQAQLNADEIIGLTYGTTKVHFRIKWVGAPNTPKAGRLGLLNLTPEKPLWDFPLPEPSDDGSWRDARDRRAHPRLKCVCSSELYPAGQTAPFRTRCTDISLGGCFIEMNLPLPKGTSVKIALWIKESKLWATGKVVTSTPGFGIGVQFKEISELDKQALQQFIQSNTRISTL